MAGLLPRGLVSVLVALALIFAPAVQTLAADSGSGTVEDMFQNKKSDQESGQSKNQSNKAENERAAVTPYGDSNLFLVFVKLVFALLLVLALIYLLYRFAVKRTGRFHEGGSLKNLGGVSVGTNRSVQLVQVGNEVMVIGVGDTVQLLKEIKDPEAIEALSQQEGTPGHLEDNVLGLLKWTSGKHTDGQDENDISSVLTMAAERLKQLGSERTLRLKEVLREVGKDA